MKKVTAALVMMMFGGLVLAHPDCPGVYEYRIVTATPYDSGWVYEDAIAGACSALAALVDANNPSQYTSNARIVNQSGRPFQCRYDTYLNSGTFLGSPVISIQEREALECPQPEECDTDAPEVGTSFVTLTSVPAESCNPMTQCKMKRGSGLCIGSSCVFTVTHTTESCGGTEPALSDGPPGEKCAEGSEVEFCKAAPPDPAKDQNCGFLNGSFVCLGSVEDDGCKVFPDGSRVCGGSAPTPPVPDNGTPGQPALPDEVMDVTNVNNEVTVNNYYNSSTVANSNRPPGMSGDNPYDGNDDGDGAGGGASGGGSEGDPAGECPAGATCDGTLPDEGEFEEVCTIKDCTQELWTRLRESPLISAMTSATSSWPAGACPDASFELWGQTLDFADAACTMWDSLAGAIGTIVLVIFGWLGLRVILSA